MPHLAAFSLLVRNYDEAIRYFTEVLGFLLIEDTPRDADRPGKRWVLVAPSAAPGAARLLLAEAVDDEQRAAVGRQGGGRVVFFYQTDDFARDYARLQAQGTTFLGAPRDEPYGRVVVFLDLYGNKWDLIEPL